MRLNQRFFSKKLVIIFLLLVSGVSMVSSAGQNPGQADQGLLSDAELDAVLQDADRVAQENQITEEAIDQTVRDVEALLDELDRQDPRPLGDFHNTVLFEIPLGDPVPGRNRELLPVMQFTGHNLLQLVFIAARCGLDALFFKYLKKYFFQGILNNFEDKNEKILESLLCVERDENGEFLWNESSQKILIDSFFVAFSPDDTSTKKIWLLLGLYALASEVYRATEHETMSMPWSGVVDFGTKQVRRVNQQHENGKVVFPGPSILFSLVNSWVLGGESMVAGNLHVLRNSVLRFAGMHHEIFENCWFEYAKRSLILTRFLGQTKAYFSLQSRQWAYEHKNELCALVGCLHKAKEIEDVEIQQKIKDRLKIFAMQAYDYPFFQWLRFKGSCQFWTTIWIELLLMTPALIKVSYKFVRE